MNSRAARVKVRADVQLKTPMHPFDLRTALLAKHAQHVVLVHFPIALFLTGVAFDVCALRVKRAGVADAAYFNFLIAAVMTFPVVVSGLMAWQWQLEGQRLKGVLLFHLVSACLASVLIWGVWGMHYRERRGVTAPRSFRMALELVGVAVVAMTGHLGGFLSGVNGPL